jgi:LysM repeat protein
MAAAVIGTDARRFGFDLASETETRERYDVVTIPAITRLSSVARDAGTTVAELRTANTDLSPTATTTPARNYPIYVPRGGGERLAGSLAASPSPAGASWPTASPPAAAAPPGGAERRIYRVQRGDTLSEIAERHGVGYREVATWNELRPPYRLAVGQELVLYPRGRVPERLVYTVKRGNTLRTIADIFAVRYRDIMAWNNLRGSTLRIGQKLIIHPPRPVRLETYRVARGDTVAKIARRFGVPVREVLTANGLRSRTLIRPGDRLVVYVGA